MNATLSIDTIRIFLHVFATTVWVGGQIVMLSLVPIMRSAEVEGLTAKAAQGFQRVAWPFFGLAVVTGIWNILAIDMADASSGYNAVFGIKFLLVIVSGVAAWMHSKTDSAAVRGITGGVGFLAALIAMFLGFVMTH